MDLLTALETLTEAFARKFRTTGAAIAASVLLALCSHSTCRAAAGLVPFSLVDGHILVSARVNGQGPFTFVLDTGADASFLDSATARRVGLTIEHETNVDSFGAEPIEAGISGPAGIAIGSSLLTSQTFLIVDMASQYLPIGTPVQGVLGSDVFKRYVVALDSSHSELSLTPNAQFDSAGIAGGLPLQFEPHGVPLIQATVDGALGWFEIDTGSNGGVVLYPGFFQQNRRHFAGEKLSAPLVRGEIGGSVETQTIPSAKILIGPYSATLTPLEILTTNPAHIAGLSVAGNIGESVFENFTVIIDYKDRTLFLLPAGTPIPAASDTAVSAARP